MMVTEIIESTCGNTTKPLGMVEEALKLAGVEREQLECVAIGLGPGSYTGVRVAIALAQGWQLARGVKLLGISSAECIASQAQLNGLTGICSVVIDARRDEFYLATYEITATELREVKPLKLVPMEKVLECQKAGGVFIGPEVTRWFAEGRVVFPRAATLGGLALERKDFVKGEQLEPIYLRETNFVKAPPPRIVS
jgi:tRNA threonylcarbamoyl adenosine modification protein YeaZ